MDMDPPPRKQLRLLVKGREKVTGLLRRRRRQKEQKAFGSRHEDENSDIEDEVPILSRIADPASELKDTACNKGKGSRSPSIPRPINDTTGMIRSDSGADKMRKREGVTSIGNLEDTSTRAFSAKTVMAQHRPIAKQPSSTHEDTKFTFKTDFPSTSGNRNLPSVGPHTVRNISPQPRLQQAAHNAWPDPDSQPKALTNEECQSRSARTKAGTQDENTTAQITPTKHIGQATCHPVLPSGGRLASIDQAGRSPPVQPRRLFDTFKLGHNPAVQAPRIDAPSPLEKISNFVPPQLPIPEPAPAVYRSVYHKPNISRALMQRSLPDSIESQHFIEDVETGLSPSRKNENGDVPALVGDAHIERVPIRARHGGLPAKIPVVVNPGTPITQASKHAFQVLKKPRDSLCVPENLHTEPRRLAKAYFASSHGGLKRERPTGTTLPPPSYVHQHTSSPTFNIFTNGILLYPELCLMLAAQLPVQTLINLYSISKDFHIILNQRLTTVMLNQATVKTPAAARCYPWRCYAHLCQPDPAYSAATVHINRSFQAHTDGSTINLAPPPPAAHEATALPGPYTAHTLKNPFIRPLPSRRRVPTFGWLQLALHREKTIHEIYHLFAARGVPLPGDPTDTSRNSFCLTLHKLWFAFDIPDNTRRIAYFKSHVLITPQDLANILTFIVKVDMVCNDPLAGEKRDALRKLFMSSVNGFDTLRRVLKREIWTDELEVLRAWMRYGFQLDREDPGERPVGGGWVPLNLSEEDHAASDFIFGIPRDEVGLLKKEFWGKLDYNVEEKRRTLVPVGRRTAYLMRPDQIVLREAVRRGMKMGKQFFRALMVGYVDEKTLGAVPPRDLNGGRSRVLEEEGEYGVDDLVGGVKALGVEDGGDPLLDLGNTWEGSPLTVKRVGARKQQVERMKEEKERLEAYKRGWREDVERDNARRAYRGFTYVDG